MEDIKVKSVVCLPSNRSTPMSVESIDGEYATCVWLDSKKKMYREQFRMAVLELVPDEAPGFVTIG
jgi:hypothetical protein